MLYFKLSKTGSSHEVLQQNFVAEQLEENCDIGTKSVVLQFFNHPNFLSLATDLVTFRQMGMHQRELAGKNSTTALFPQQPNEVFHRLCWCIFVFLRFYLQWPLPDLSLLTLAHDFACFSLITFTFGSLESKPKSIFKQKKHFLSWQSSSNKVRHGQKQGKLT